MVDIHNRLGKSSAQTLSLNILLDVQSTISNLSLCFDKLENLHFGNNQTTILIIMKRTFEKVTR